MRSSVALAAALACACSGGRDRDEQATATQHELAPRHLERTTPMQMPADWSERYDAEHDRWTYASRPRPDGRTVDAILDAAPAPSVASPEALRHYLAKQWPAGTTAEFEDREAISSGFATTLAVRSPSGEAHREVHVITQLGPQWFHCRSTWVPDDTARADVLALCTSLRRHIGKP